MVITYFPEKLFFSVKFQFKQETYLEPGHGTNGNAPQKIACLLILSTHHQKEIENPMSILLKKQKAMLLLGPKYESRRGCSKKYGWLKYLVLG